MIGNLLITSLLIAMGAPGTALAQDDEVSLEEVLVTARKIEERLQDVPLAISAFSAREIESAAIENLDDVANFTPGLTFSSLLGEFLPVPVIRGIAPTAVQDRENNASIFVDGIYISGRQGLNFSQLDLERIEVIKGPQAAMYGRNSFSGAINIVTARPTDEVSAKGELTIGDVLRGRIAVIKNQWDGSYGNQVPGGPDIGGFDYETLQGSLYWTPSENFEAGLSLYVSNDQIDMSATSAVAANCENTSPFGERLNNFCGDLPSINENDLSVITRATGEDRDIIRTSLSLTWDTDAGTFTSLTGFSKVQQSFFVDGSRGDATTTLAYQTIFAPFPGAFVLDTFEAELLQIGPGAETEEVSQEFRFSSPEDRSVRYSAGAYFYSVDGEERNSGVVSQTPLPFGFGGFCPCIEFFPGVGFALAPFPGAPFTIGDLAFGDWFDQPNGSVNNSIDEIVGTDAWAIFGAVEADFSDTITGRFELRYTDEEKSSQDLVSGADLKNSWDFITWRATLDFKPSENTMFYGSIAGAEKSGDFDFDTEFNANGEFVSLVSLIDPEKNTSYELGTKGTYLGGRLQSDIAVFYIDWTDIVIPQLQDTDDNGVPLAATLALDKNAGDATVMGLEASFAYAFTESLTGNFGFSITESEFDNANIQSFAAFPSFAPDGNVDGNTLQRQSKTQANATLNYRRPFRDDSEWYVRGDVLYTGKQFLGAPNQGVIPSHTYVNLRVGLEGDRYSVELWSENLFDDDTPVAGFRDVFFSNTLPGGGAGGFFNTFFPFRTTLSHPRLRQIGVTLKARF
jgi:iron complex outermembrane receptor protein